MGTRNPVFFLSIVQVALWQTKNFLTILLGKGRNRIEFRIPLLIDFPKELKGVRS